MLVKIESAPFEGGKLRHSTSNQLLINKRKAVNSNLHWARQITESTQQLRVQRSVLSTKGNCWKDQRVEHTSSWVKVRCGLKKLKASIHTLHFIGQHTKRCCKSSVLAEQNLHCEEVKPLSNFEKSDCLKSLRWNRRYRRDRLSGETGIVQKSDHLEVSIGDIAGDGRDRCIRDSRNGLGL
jgi:hypothetical protein